MMDYKKTVVQDAESAETYYFEDDAKRILDILNEFQERLPSLQQGEEYRAQMAEKFAKHACFLVLCLNGRKIGFSAFYANDSDTKSAFISQIAVLKEYSRRNFGGKLLDLVSSTAKARGMLWLRLEVRKDNSAARRFYEKNGFQEVSEASKDSMYLQKHI
ncbi:MAG: GNAT family N-acetyltransferase [Lachnospiraceae bacterium]|nr:GNAT family N-acetyltransferase [Oscillospiraceae bacterium]